MAYDAALKLSAEQALTASAESTYKYDFESVAPQVGKGTPIFFNVAVGATALDSSGEAATLTIALQTSADGSSFTDLLIGPAIAEASCTAGALLMKVPLPSAGLLRYVKAYYTVGTENFTSGTINAWLSID